MQILKKVFTLKSSSFRYLSAAMIGFTVSYCSVLIMAGLNSSLPSWDALGELSYRFVLVFAYAALLCALLLFIWDKWPKPFSAKRLTAFLFVCAAGIIALFVALLAFGVVVCFLITSRRN